MIRSIPRVAIAFATVALAGCKEATAVNQGCRLVPVVLAGVSTVPVGGQAQFTISYPCGRPSPLFADWQVADTTVATIKATSDTTAVLLGKRVGETAFTLDVPRSRISGELAVVEKP